MMMTGKRRRGFDFLFFSTGGMGARDEGFKTPLLMEQEMEIV